MSSFPNRITRPRPFPWRCIKCREKEVRPLEFPYVTNVKHDGRDYVISIPNLPIPTCGKCGEQVFSSEEDDRITAALRTKIGLQMPEEILQARIRLELSQQELAEQIGVSEQMIVKWESGLAIQSRAMDNLLRLFFQSADARRLLSTRFERDSVTTGAKPAATVA
jgi:putative zinc finger/helix-turn-helix YgiT family protein